MPSSKASLCHPTDGNALPLECEALESRIMLAAIQIDAAGVTGAESINVEIAGQVVQTFNNLGTGAYRGNYVPLTLTTAGSVSADDVRIVFTNDFYDPANGIDRNVRIDAITIDGQRFETEASNVFSTGTWLPADGVVAGFRESEFLHINGYFQYADGGNTGDGFVVINEIHYNPGPNVDSDSEFVELYNPGGTAVDLSGMSFVGFDLVFTAGTTLGAGEYATVAPSIALSQSTWGVTPIQEFAAGGISGGGELIQLIAADGVTVVDEVDYDDATPWPSSPDGNGPSMELIDPLADNSQPENWGASDGDPTPAAQNSIFGDDGQPDITNITVTPGVVLPNQAFTISANIEGATTATLVYRVMFGGEVSVAMTNTGDDGWSATLPGASEGTLIRYRIESDVEFAPFAGDSINYFGLVVSPTDIVDNTLPVLQLFYDPADLAFITSPEQVLIKTKIEVIVAYGNQVVDNAEMRVRGGDFGRVNFPKQSFKIELPSGYAIDVGTESDYAIDEFGIQAEYADWSFVAADISWDIFNAETDFYSASFYTRVEGNSDFFGIYRFQELYDGEWRKQNDIVDDDQFFQSEFGWDYPVEEGWDQKNPDDEDLTDIAAMKAVLETAASPAKTQWLYENVDIAATINYMAISALIRHGDQQEHNFYMSLDSETGLWETVQWDLDQTWRDVFGGPGAGQDFTTLEAVNNDFMDAMWEVPEFQDMYWRRLQTLVDTYLQDDQIIDRRGELLESIGASNSALEFQAWGRTDIYQSQDLADEWEAAVEARRAIFAAETRLPGSSPSNPNIVINELHYNPAGNDAEFLELYNGSNTAIDLSDWTVDGNGLTIQNGTVILPGEYVVFTDSILQFAAQSSAPSVYIGGQYPGGLSGSGETITLMNANGAVIDQVSYTDTAPWPAGADGTGFTLALIDPNLDNSVASNWQVSSLINGTPSAANDTSTTEIKILAAGTSGNETIRLEVAGQNVATYTLANFGGQAGDLQSRQFIELTSNVVGAFTADDVRVYFTNDFFDAANGIDYNVGIDRIEVNGVIFETEAPNVFSTGTWLPADGVVPGFRLNEVLHINGYFQYAGSVLQAGNIVQLTNVFHNAWLAGVGVDAVTSTNNTATTYWELIDAGGNGLFTLRNVANNRYLDGDNNDVDTHASSSAGGIIWQFQDAGNGDYFLYNVMWNEYLEADGSNAPVDYDSGSLSADDRWTVSLVAGL